jgi:hypothetical protein
MADLRFKSKILHAFSKNLIITSVSIMGDQAKVGKIME